MGGVHLNLCSFVISDVDMGMNKVVAQNEQPCINLCWSEVKFAFFKVNYLLFVSVNVKGLWGKSSIFCVVSGKKKGQ